MKITPNQTFEDFLDRSQEMQLQKVPVDALKELYLEVKKKLATEQERGQPDITDVFWYGLRQKLEKGENPTIVTKGQSAKGKSTVNITIAYILNQLIREVKSDTTLNKTGEIDMFPLISANQIEFIRIARQEVRQVCTCIDEFSDLGTLGTNSSTEMALLEWYDKICAQKYIYKLFATPRSDFDKYGLLILEVIDVDKMSKITKLKLYYNNPSDPLPTYLGVITIDVGEILDKPWYKLYMKKKHFSMNLTLQHGVKDVRELEFALATLMLYEKNKKLIEAGIKEPDIIACKIDEVSKELKQPYSLIAKEELISKANAFLALPFVITTTNARLNNPNVVSKLSSNEITRLKKTVEICTEEFEKLYQEQMKLIKLYFDYLSIGDNYILQETLLLCKKYHLIDEVTNGN